MAEMGNEVYARLDRLGTIGAESGALTRMFLSPEQKQASTLVLSWMHEAGMTAQLDAIGNVVGRYEGDRPGLPALMLGSHLDTVRNAGRYDGMLGVVAAIACVKELSRRGARLPFAVEVVGFCDEEGARFGATLLGSRAVAGSFDPAVLDAIDDHGLTMRAAMTVFGLDPDRIGDAARSREALLAYVELHIEQGPVLEHEGLPVGTVTSISGASRLRATLRGQAGHAGTVPMSGRRDALAAAAACVLAVEDECSKEPGLVGTVGRIESRPGAINVIPGEAFFTLDVRAPQDRSRLAAVDRLRRRFATIGQERGVTVELALLHDSPAVPCAGWLMDQIDAAIAREDIAPFRLASGAGHDGLAMQAIADIGMIFLRCTGGVSHDPAEAITVADAETGARVLLGFIESFRA